MDRETLDEIKRHFGIVVEDVRSDVRGVAEGVDALRDELHREVGAVRTEMGEEIGSLRMELGQGIGSVRDELGSTREELGSQIRALAQEFGTFRGGVAEEFEETRALVRLSYGQIDQRVRTLETEMADIRARLERVEGQIAS